MNERIKELAKQAGLEMWINGNDEVEISENQEKFAELIIQECVESIPADGHRGDFGRAIEFCQQQIKQHFGVEL